MNFDDRDPYGFPQPAKKTDLILGACLCALIVTLIILAWLTWGAS